MKRHNFVVFASIFLILGVSTLVNAKALAQESSSSEKNDPFQTQVREFTLDQQSLPDAIAKLSQNTNVAYSIEFQLGETISDPAPTLKLLTVNVGGTVSEVLDHLCKTDPTFTWKRIGNAANVFPRDLDGVPTYLLNKTLPVVSLKAVKDAEQAVFETIAQIPGPKEQIAVLQSGLSLSFANPYSATFHNITVREVFDHISEQLGDTVGWQFGGAADFRVITFHRHLEVKPKSQPATIRKPS